MRSRSGWVAVINPRSGGGRSASALAALRRRLSPLVDDIVLSRHPGHVGEIVRDACTATGILVAGGDGTIFEALQACDRGRQRLAILPFGRGNSLARDLGLRSQEAALAALASGGDRRIDVMSITIQTRDAQWRGVSASNVALGYPARVAADASRWGRMGARSYAIAAMLAAPAPMMMRVTMNGIDAATPLTGVIVSQSCHVGPFVGFPTADLQDGRFHVMRLRAGRLRQTVHNLSSLTGLRFYEPGVVEETNAIHIAVDAPSLLEIDGEMRNDVMSVSVDARGDGVTIRVPRRAP